MNKTALFPIGEFSQLTGTTIKSLHYYEKINILTPAWIDESSGYRYYDLHQIRQVEAIELLLDLDIRLNQFPEYASTDFTEINYKKILEHGKTLTLQKIKELENKMRYIDFIEETLENRSNLTASASFTPLWLMPYNEQTSALSMNEILKKMNQEIRPFGLSFRHSFGRIMFCTGKIQRIYYFMDLKIPAGKRIFHENIFYLPDGEYRVLDAEDILLEDSAKLFKELFSQSYDKIVLETDGKLSCLLPA